MFSVGASPFNSPVRARYGGWAPTDVQVTGNGATDFDNYMAYKMAAMYNTAADPEQRTAARQLSKDIYATYKALKEQSPNHPQYLAWKARKNAWRGPFVRTPMPDAMRQGIFNAFRGLQAQPSWANRKALQVLRQAPYRPVPTAAQLAPYQLGDVGVPTHWGISAGLGRTRGRIYANVPEFNLENIPQYDNAPVYQARDAANMAEVALPAF